MEEISKTVVHLANFSAPGFVSRPGMSGKNMLRLSEFISGGLFRTPFQILFPGYFSMRMKKNLNRGDVRIPASENGRNHCFPSAGFLLARLF